MINALLDEEAKKSRDGFCFNIKTGIRCETKCPEGLYGEDCHSRCECMNNSSCDPTTGSCVCARGWGGPDCSQPCKEGWYGMGCKEKCPEKMNGRNFYIS